MFYGERFSQSIHFFCHPARGYQIEILNGSMQQMSCVSQAYHDFKDFELNH